MKKLRFFATLKFARQLPYPDRESLRLVLNTFQYGWTIGWYDKSGKYIKG